MTSLFSSPKRPKISPLPSVPEPEEEVAVIEEEAEEAARRERKRLLAGGRRTTILSGIQSAITQRLKRKLGE